MKSENKNLALRGSKGGGSAQPTAPIELSDTLRSKQVGQIVDALSEGEIVGLANGLQSIFFDETPLMNKDGTFNFRDVSTQVRVGTPNQEPFNGTKGEEFELAVGIEVTKNTAITRTITTPNVGAVRVTLGFPQLTEQNKETGDIGGARVNYIIAVQSNGGGFVDRINETVNGKSTSRYQRAHMIELTGTGPFDIRVTRVTADSTSALLNNKMYFDSIAGIIPVRLTYPNTAAIAIRLDAANFSAIPSRSYDIYGMIVRVPSNYNPKTRTYAGVWDGTFMMAWTDNPAWCFYDLITSKRYGAGKFIDVNTIDKWSLYSIGRYCDQMVPNGFGGLEPRFTCNLYLQTQEEAYTVIQNFASIFRAITYWGAGSIVSTQDRPSDPIAQFTNANVVDGAFTYAGSSLKQRHTVALVTWNNPKNFYRAEPEYVQDDNDVARYGIIETSVVAMGCSSQGQANRMGRWLLATERYSTETIAFKTGIDGCNLYPGAIIKTADVNRAGQRMGGRVIKYTPDEHGNGNMQIDQSPEIDPSHEYTISISLDGQMVTRTMYNHPAGPNVVGVFGSLPRAPVLGDVYVITDVTALQPELWRVTGVAPNESGEVDVSAVAYVPGIYQYVEENIAIDPPPTSTINTRPPAVKDVTVNAIHYRIDGIMTGLKALVSWTSSVGRYRVMWRRPNGAWQAREVYESSVELDNIEAAIYEISVTAISAIGRESAAVVVSIDMRERAESGIDTLAPPTNLMLEMPYIGTLARFKWDGPKTALGYEVQLGKGGDPFVPRRTVKIGNVTRFSYSPQDMAQDGGPWRSVTIRVRTIGPFNKTSAWVAFTAGNPQVAALQGIEVSPTMRAIYMNCAQPADLDFIGIMVWLGTTPDFIPSDHTLVYDDVGTFATIHRFLKRTDERDPEDIPAGELPVYALDPDTQYYLKAAGYDALGKDELNYSASIPTKILKFAPDVGTIIADMIADGALTITKFADGITPISIVDTLPALPGTPPYVGSSIVSLTSANGRLYKRVGNTWQAETAQVGPGSVGPTELTDSLKASVERIDGPEATPGTVANQIANKVQQLSDVVDEKLDYVGSITNVAIAAAQQALKAASTSSSAMMVRTTALIARVGTEYTAAIYEESQARVTALQSLANTVSGLSSTWGQDIDAAITEYQSVVASQFAAQSQTIDQVSSTVAGHTTTIQQQATSINGVKARVEVKIDNNGVISGYALDSTTDRNGTPTSAMVFAVDKFQIKAAGASLVTPFEVTTRGGSPVVTIAGTRISDGTITAPALAADSVIAGKIAAGAVNTAQLAAGAITTDVIVIGTNGGIPGTMIKDGQISTQKLVSGAVTADKILGNTITGDKIVANTLTGDHLQVNSIQASRIDSRGLSIKDTNGNVILSAGVGIDWNAYIVNRPTSLSGLNPSEGTKLGGIASGATKNITTTSSSAPINPSEGDIWVNTGSTPYITYIRNSSGWVSAANYTTNTSQLSDGAGLGTTALWNGVYGSGKPADNATVGAQFGVNLLGQITAANVSTYIASAAIGAAYIGNLAAEKITTGTLTGIEIDLGIGNFRVKQISGAWSTQAQFLSGTRASYDNTSSPVGYPISGTANVGPSTYAAVYGGSSCNAPAMYALGSGSSLNCHGFRGKSSAYNASGLVGATNGKAFHAELGTAGPFTGSHDVALANGTEIEPGDIVIDDGCLLRGDWSNTFFRAVRSSSANQKGAIGVYTRTIAPMRRYNLLPSLHEETYVDDFGVVRGPNTDLYYAICDHYDVCEVNALGEGQMNVCGLGGNIDAGDLIVASDLPGKGMRQADDLHRSTTVAKAREAVTFDFPEQVKVIACTYHCA